MPRRSKRLQALSQAPSVGAVSSHEEPSAVLRWFLTHEDGMHMSMLTRFLGGADLFWLALASKSVLRGVRKDVLLQHGGADADTQCLWRLLAQRAERERPRSFGRGGARFGPGEQRTCYVAANGRVHALALADGSKLWSSEMRYAMDEEAAAWAAKPASAAAQSDGSSDAWTSSPASQASSTPRKS